MGASGVVYRVYDRVRRIDVALKSLRDLDGASLYRFKNEFRALAGIVHDNLVTLYELLAQGDEWFFTMDLVDGVSFLEYVRPHATWPIDADDASARAAPKSAVEPDASSPPSDPEHISSLTMPTQAGTPPGRFAAGSGEPRPQALFRRQALIEATPNLERLRQTLVELVDGLLALHAAGKLHRDIKPSNVLVSREGRVVVCDFGLVADRASTSDGDSKGDGGGDGSDRPRAQLIVGTPAYMSPEQAGGRDATEASDWYGVGVIVYEALTGRLPFGGRLDQLLGAKQSQDPLPPRHYCPELPTTWDALCMALLARDPAARPGGADILAALGSSPESAPAERPARRQHPGPLPFVGRERQLGELHHGFAESRAGLGIVVLLTGHSGMGKSALAQRFVEEARDGHDALIFQSRCFERESVPYKALDGLVDAVSEHLLERPGTELAGLLPADFPSLVRLFPVLSRIPMDGTQPFTAVPLDPQALRSSAFRALRELLEHIARTHPVVLYIDDLQWGDVDSAPFFGALLHGSHPPPLMLLATCRADALDSSPLVAALLHRAPGAGANDRLRQIEVGPLEAGDARRLALLAMEDGSAEARARADAIAHDAAGSPLFVAELARASSAAREHAGTLSLDDVIATRIAELDPDARALLTAAAVAGRPMAIGLLSRAAGIRDEPGALATLEAQRLIRSHRHGAHERIDSYHDRIRETIVGRLSEADARKIHRRLARACEAFDQDDPEPLVAHWLGAGDLQRAGTYALRAAERAYQATAFERAAHYYQLALEHLALPTLARLDATARLGDALASSGNLTAAADVYTRAAVDAPRDLALELRRRAVQQVLRAGRLDEGLEMSKELLHSVGVTMPRSDAAAIASIVWSRLRLSLRGMELRRHGPGEVPDEDRRRMDVCWSVSHSMNVVNPILGGALHLRYVRDALDSGDIYRAAIALSAQCGFQATAGTRVRPAIEKLVLRAAELCRDSGIPYARGINEVVHGISMFMFGEFRRTVELSERALETFTSHSSEARYEADQASIWRLAGLFYLGRIRELTESALALFREGIERRDEYLLTALRSWRSSIVWLVLDDPGEAARQLAVVVDRQSPGHAFHVYHYYQLLTRTQLELYQGRGAQAWEFLEEKWPRLRRSVGMRVESVRLDASFLRARTALTAAIAADGRPREELLRHAQRAIRAIDKELAPWGKPLAHLARGCLALAHNDAPAATAAFAAAEQGFIAHDMQLLAIVARRRLGQLSADTTAAALVESTTAWMQSEGIVAPDRFTALFAPAP